MALYETETIKELFDIVCKPAQYTVKVRETVEKQSGVKMQEMMELDEDFT